MMIRVRAGPGERDNNIYTKNLTVRLELTMSNLKARCTVLILTNWGCVNHTEKRNYSETSNKSEKDGPVEGRDLLGINSKVRKMLIIEKDRSNIAYELNMITGAPKRALIAYIKIRAVNAPSSMPNWVQPYLFKFDTLPKSWNQGVTGSRQTIKTRWTIKFLHLNPCWILPEGDLA